jgi:hypothetical protein
MKGRLPTVLSVTALLIAVAGLTPHGRDLPGDLGGRTEPRRTGGRLSVAVS